MNEAILRAAEEISNLWWINGSPAKTDAIAKIIKEHLAVPAVVDEIIARHRAAGGAA